MLLSSAGPTERMAAIAASRRAVLHAGGGAAALAPWIDRSWRRCLAWGHRPHSPVAFDLVSVAASRRAIDANVRLREAAAPVLRGLSQAMQSTRYFALLTDAAGVVVAADGPIDRRDRRAQLITRVGVDLSERSVGTTAISAALTELQPVWLHRGEHFFDDTSAYSCAGAPIFDGRGTCVGMLDLTGIDAPERPELTHLVARSAQAISNALVTAPPHVLRLRLSWPGIELGADAAGLVCVDADGVVTGLNAAAQQMLGARAAGGGALHCEDVFAMQWQQLFRLHEGEEVDVPLWSGLMLRAQLARSAATARTSVVATPRTSHADAQAGALRDVELTLIHRAVTAARGNVEAAARALGISRATVYRKLQRKPPDRSGG